MEAPFYSKQNLRFTLRDIVNVSALLDTPHFGMHSLESIDMILDAADALSEQHLRPILKEMDSTPPHLENGVVKVHPAMRGLMKKFGEDGWISLSAPIEHGGQQAPFTVLQAAAFIMAAANYSTMAYPFLTNGAAHLIESFGSKELQQVFVPRMYAGEWQGTMALTEPQAGSSLSDITTSATSTPEGHYLIKGQKVFISCGDHNACDNVVHLMLARIHGAPEGTKGISLFVVPKFRISEGILIANDVNTAGVFHKMGYHGAPITHLIMGENSDCHGYLVGEPHKGLSYMFQMMNEARVGVGLQATSIATAAYYNSLTYSRERTQGRRPGEKNPSTEQIAIIEHADVRRLLLFQKAIVEGSLSLCLQCTMYLDLSKCDSDSDKEKYYLLAEILTPIAKSYPAEMSILSTSAALQCFGGYGYTKEYLAELYFRETRIHTLHEGTTAIHGMDLLGRKITMKGGAAVATLLTEINMCIEEAAQNPITAKAAEDLKTCILKLQKTTGLLLQLAQEKGAENYLANASVYLEAFGIVTIAWQWLKQANIANRLIAENKKQYNSDFLQSKIKTMEYFFGYELPKLNGLLNTLNNRQELLLNFKSAELL